MKLQESGEMYLETILLLTQKKSFVRAIDVGEEMGFSKPSVSRAIGLLRNGGFVEVGDGGGLSLCSWRWAWMKRLPPRTPAVWSMSSRTSPSPPSRTIFTITKRRAKTPATEIRSGCCCIWVIMDYFTLLIASRIAVLGCTPTARTASLPSLKTIRVGTLMIP